MTKPYTFEDLECSLDARIKQVAMLANDINSLNRTIASLKYDIRKMKDELLKEKIRARVPCEDVEDVISVYFSSNHHTIETDRYFIGFLVYYDNIHIAFLWTDGTYSAKKEALKETYKYIRSSGKEVYFNAINNKFAANSEETWKGIYKLML